MELLHYINVELSKAFGISHILKAMVHPQIHCSETQEAISDVNYIMQLSTSKKIYNKQSTSTLTSPQAP